MARKRKRPIRQAYSAGGVVFRHHDASVEVLLLQHASGRWMLPKGTIEPGASPEAEALREVWEETALRNVRVVADLGEERYTFYWKTDGTYYDKTVHYYLMEWLGGEEAHPQEEEGFVAIAWLPPADAHARIKYRETREVLRRAQAELARRYPDLVQVRDR